MDAIAVGEDVLNREELLINIAELRQDLVARRGGESGASIEVSRVITVLRFTSGLGLGLGTLFGLTHLGAGLGVSAASAAAVGIAVDLIFRHFMSNPGQQ